MTTLTNDRANEIIRETFAAAGLSGRDVPALSDDGRLSDGNYDEPADLRSESDLRAQCQDWIAGATHSAKADAEYGQITAELIERRRLRFRLG
jgi:hypothetical protein